MNLQSRNTGFKAAIIISGAAFVFIAGAAFAALPVYPQVTGESAFRSSGLVQGFITARIGVSPYAPFISALSAVIFSCVSINLIRHFFEKTQSEEIFFIGLFVLSLAFECFRIMVPLKNAIGLPGIYLFLSSRLLIFGRCFGLFSLFAAGICAAGLKLQKQRNIVFSIVVIALIVAIGVPIDTLSWDSALNLHSGYDSMFSLVEAGLPVITILSFLVTAYTRSIREYLAIGLGILIIILGRNILLDSDTLITPLPGLLTLTAGTWLVCTRLHRVYLWI